MRVTPVDLTTGFGKDNAKAFNAQDVLCWIPEAAEGASVSPMKLRCAPGLNPYVDMSDSPVRGMHVAQDRMFVVAGSTLWEVTGLESARPWGTIPGVGRVEAAHNLLPTGHEVMFVNGSAGYVFDTRTNTFAKVTDAGYPGSWTVDYIDGYMMQADPFGRFAFYSDVAQAKEYNTLDRFDSEVSPDKIVRPIVSQSEVVVFSERSTEFFANTGATTGTFQSRRVSMERGIGKARYSAFRLDNSIFWLGDDGVFYRLNGYNAQPIAPRAIQDAIKGYDWSQCIGYAIEAEGHKLAYWTFPGGKTFGYDVVTGLWHRMASPGLSRWRVSHLVKWRGKWYGGDFQRGRVYEVDWSIADDNGELVERELITPHLHDGLNAITPLRMELLFNTGGDVSRGRAIVRAVTVTGNLPDGAEGDMVSATYTAIGGVGPYTYSVVSGAVPTGLSLSSGGVLSGTVTAGGSFTWTVQATDSEGRTAVTVDTATFIEARETLALGEVTVGVYGFQSSPSGLSFASPAIIPSPGFPATDFAITSTGRMVVVSGLTTARYSDNGGGTWTSVTIPTVNVSSAAGVFFKSGVLLIPGGQSGSGILRSVNNSVSYSVVESTRAIGNIAGHPSLFVALSTTSAPSYSTNLGETWSAEGPRLDMTADAFSAPSASGGASDGTRVLFCGQAFFSGAAAFGAAVAYTSNGTDWTIKRIEATPTTQATSAAYHSGIWIVGCQNGDVYRSTDLATWARVAQFLGRVEKVAHNGVSFYVCGAASGAGYIYRSATGLAGSWASVSHPFSLRVESIAAVPA